MEEKKEDSFEKQELLIDKKIAEAKFEVVEKRNQFLLWFFGIMLTIAGVAIPLLLSFNTQNRADKEIENMKSEMKEVKLEQEKKLAEYKNEFREEFKEIVEQQNIALNTISNSADKTLKETKEQVQALIGQQLTKPELVLRYKGQEVDGKTIDITGIENWSDRFEVYNKGEAAAKNTRIIIYIKSESQIENYVLSGWNFRESMEEPGYTKTFYNKEEINTIDSKYVYPIVGLDLGYSGKRNIKDEWIVKLFYGQKEPTVAKIKIAIN